MPTAGAPIPLTLGKSSQVPATPQGGGGGSNKIAGVLVQNLSAYTLLTGYGAQTTYIPPFTAWPLPQTSGVVTVTPETLGATIPAGASSTVIPVYYGQGEELPPPTTLVAAAIASAIAGSVAVTSAPPVTGTVGLTAGNNVGISGGQSGTPVTVNQQPVDIPLTGAGPSYTVAVPANVCALALNVGSVAAGRAITGQQTGSVYANYGSTDTLPAPLVVYLDPVDTHVIVTCQGNANGDYLSGYTMPPAVGAFPEIRALPVTNGGSASGGVLGGSASAAGVFLTVPVGKSWLGTVWISAATASTSTQIQAAQTGSSGPNCIPAPGTALAVVNTGTRAGAEMVVPNVLLVSIGARSVELTVAVAGTPTFNAGAIGTTF